jgi:hypothetical protein
MFNLLRSLSGGAQIIGLGNIMKNGILLSASLLALGAMFANQAEAAPAPPACTLAGAVTAGGILTGVTASSGGTSVSGNWDTFFGEGAGLVTCDAWNFQSDFAYYDHAATVSNVNVTAPEGHFGGAVFYRDPGFGDYGISASYLAATNNVISGFSPNYIRVGAFGDYFVNEQATLGLAGHYFHTTHDTNLFGTTKNYSGFELSADAKYYVTPDFKLSLTGDLLQSQSSIAGTTIHVGGGAVTAQADYQLNENGLVGFLGGRYAHRVLWQDGGSSLNLDDKQVYIGLTFNFGEKAGSLVSHDRTGPVNNTSTFLEKLPDAFSDLVTAEGGL